MDEARHAVPLRGVCAAVFATSGVALAIGAHRLGGDPVPPLWLAGACAALLCGFACAVGGAPRSRALIMTFVVASQASMHVAFAASGMHSSGMHSMGGPLSALASPAMLPMMCAHLAAAVLMGWWLARGERAVWQRARRTLRVLRALLIDIPVRRADEAWLAVPAAAVLIRGPWASRAPGRAPPSRVFRTSPTAV